MTAAQKQTLNDIAAKWRGFGYGKMGTYAAQDSDDKLLVATHPDQEPVAARVNPFGVAKVGSPDSPGMGQPLLGKP